MRGRIELMLVGLAVVAMAGSCSQAPDGDRETPPKTTAGDNKDGKSLRVAVVTGGHAFDVPNFHRMLRQPPGVDAYPQHLEHFASSPEEVRNAYDAVVFYGMNQPMPVDEGQPHYAGEPKAAIERLVERGQGVVILHHALLAWKDWDLWHRLIGFENRNFAYKEGLQLKVEVADDQHAVTQGLGPIEIVDEGYKLHGEYDGQGDVLLTVDHQDAMKMVAWARQHDKCRAFCLALGHDDLAWSTPGFREILARGIAWSAGAGK